MKISKQARRDAKQLFRSCFNNGMLDDNRVRQVVRVVIGQKPRDYVAILSQFTRLVKLDQVVVPCGRSVVYRAPDALRTKMWISPVVSWTMAEKQDFATLIRSSRGDAIVLLATFLLTIFADLVIAA